MKIGSFRQFANGLAFSLMVGMSILANVLPLNGHSTGEISGAFPTLTTPAPYAFSIWVLIYAALGGFIFYFSRVDAEAEALLKRIGPWFIIGCIANITWVVLWHQQQFMGTVIAIGVILLSLIVIYTRLQVGLWAIASRERLLITAPFSLYLGWITVVTVANISVALNYTSPFDGLGLNEALWAAIVTVIITKITLIIVITRNDFVYAGVILWALVGILSNHDMTTWLANILAVCVITVFAVSCIKLANVLMWDNNTSTLSIIERDK